MFCEFRETGDVEIVRLHRFDEGFIDVWQLPRTGAIRKTQFENRWHWTAAQLPKSLAKWRLSPPVSRRSYSLPP